MKILLRQSSSHSQKKGTSAGKTEGQTEPKQETFKEILLEREWLKKNSEANFYRPDLTKAVLAKASLLCRAQKKIKGKK